MLKTTALTSLMTNSRDFSLRYPLSPCWSSWWCWPWPAMPPGRA
jgi:hypothetical protein